MHSYLPLTALDYTSILPRMTSAWKTGHDVHFHEMIGGGRCRVWFQPAEMSGGQSCGEAKCFKPGPLSVDTVVQLLSKMLSEVQFCALAALLRLSLSQLLLLSTDS